MYIYICNYIYIYVTELAKIRLMGYLLILIYEGLPSLVFGDICLKNFL